MRSLLRSLPLVSVLATGLAGSAEAAERRADLVRYGDVQIEVVSEGGALPSFCCRRLRGIPTTMIRSRRASRPRDFAFSPEAARDRASIGPMANITLHDFARDIAEVLRG